MGDHPQPRAACPGIADSVAKSAIAPDQSLFQFRRGRASGRQRPARRRAGAKESGRNAWRVFDPAIQANLQQGLLRVSNLRGALARREFELHFQPIIDLVSRRVLGAEALIRWRRLTRGGCCRGCSSTLRSARA
jgi:hypothetical protein